MADVRLPIAAIENLADPEPLARDEAEAFLAEIRRLHGSPGKTEAVSAKMVPELNPPKHHFLYQMIQFADHSLYSKASTRKMSPSLTFRITPCSVIMETNDDGFTRADVLEICKADASSSKTLAVFNVARKVHIQSGIWSFCFANRGESNSEMITPLSEPPTALLENVTTRITLTLQDHVRDAYEDFVRAVRDFPSTTTLFLKNLDQVTIRIEHPQDLNRTIEIVATRETRGSTGAVARLSHRKQCLQGSEQISFESKTKYYHVFRQHIEQMPGDSHCQDRRTAVVQLAFPVNAITGQPKLSNSGRHVYSHLLLQKVPHLPFLVQSDFITSASYERILDCDWNNALLNGVAHTFASAVTSFATKNHRLRYSWLEFLPSRSMEHPWGGLYSKIIESLESKPILQTWKERTFKCPLELIALIPQNSHRHLPIYDELPNELYLAPEYGRTDNGVLTHFGVPTIDWRKLLVRELLKLSNAEVPPVKTMKDLLIKIGMTVATNGVDEELSKALEQLHKAKFLPIKSSDNVLELRGLNDDFTILDHARFGRAFQAQAILLDFSLEESQLLQPLFRHLGLADRYLSVAVTEHSEASEEGLESPELSHMISARAYALYCCAAKFNKTVALYAETDLYERLLLVKAYTTNSVSADLILCLKNRSITAKSDSASLHSEILNEQLRIYFPGDPKQRQVCCRSQLPVLVCKALGISSEKAIFPISLILSANIDALDDVMHEQDITSVTWISKPPMVTPLIEVGEQQNERRSLPIDDDLEEDSPAKGSILEGTEGRYGLGEIPGLHTPPRTPDSRRRSPRTPSPSPSPCRGRSTISRSQFLTPSPASREQASRAASHSRSPSAVPRLLEERERRRSGARTKQDADAPSTDDQADGEQSDNDQADIDGIDDGDQTDGDQNDDDQPDDGQATISEDLPTPDNRTIGVAGELHVFETLKALIPDFSTGNWRSKLMGAVKILAEYEDLVCWTDTETADFVYIDENGDFTRYLQERSYAGFPCIKDGTSGTFERIEYLIEVKTTTSACNTQFFVSKKQYQLMQDYQIKPDERPTHIYVIFRVFQCMSETDIDTQIYVDPWSLQDTELNFKPQGSWFLTPVRKRRGVIPCI